MKHNYFSAWLLLGLLCLCGNPVYAQFQTNIAVNPDVDTTYGARMRHIFGPLEKNRIPYGLLRDCAMEFTNLESYNGSYTADSTVMDAGIFYEIYQTLCMAKVNNDNDALLPSPADISNQWFAAGNRGKLPWQEHITDTACLTLIRLMPVQSPSATALCRTTWTHSVTNSTEGISGINCSTGL